MCCFIIICIGEHYLMRWRRHFRSRLAVHGWGAADIISLHVALSLVERWAQSAGGRCVHWPFFNRGINTKKIWISWWPDRMGRLQNLNWNLLRIDNNNVVVVIFICYDVTPNLITHSPPPHLLDRLVSTQHLLCCCLFGPVYCVLCVSVMFRRLLWLRPPALQIRIERSANRHTYLAVLMALICSNGGWFPLRIVRRCCSWLFFLELTGASSALWRCYFLSADLSAIFNCIKKWCDWSASSALAGDVRK